MREWHCQVHNCDIRVIIYNPVTDNLLSNDNAFQTAALWHQHGWFESTQQIFWLVQMTTAAGVQAQIALQQTASKVLPGQIVLRGKRLPADLPIEMLTAALTALTRLPLRLRYNILKIHLEMFFQPQLDGQDRQPLRAQLKELGYTPVVSTVYPHTLQIDLTQDLKQIFAGLHKTARRHIRAVEKNPVSIMPIAEHRYAERLDQLLDAVMRRTGGTKDKLNWQQTLDFCRNHPDKAQIFGLFDNNKHGPQSLLAFAMGINHGNCVEYNIAAVCRETTIRMPMAYGPAWAMIEWAHKQGCSWFDFGGVTQGVASQGASPDESRRDESTKESVNNYDPLAGISDFKRYFTKDVQQVCEEWVLLPNPLRAHLAQVLRNSARKIRNVLTVMSLIVSGMAITNVVVEPVFSDTGIQSDALMDGSFSISNGSIKLQLKNQFKLGYSGKGENGYARLQQKLSLHDGQQYQCQADYFLPSGFYQAQQGQIALMRWDNWSLYPDHTDQGGVAINRHGQLVMMFQQMNTSYHQLGNTTVLEEGKWHTLRLIQTLSEMDGSALSELWHNDLKVLTSNLANTNGRPVTRMRFGIVSVHAGRQVNDINMYIDNINCNVSNP